jgi:hypothetical protein
LAQTGEVALAIAVVAVGETVAVVVEVIGAVHLA